MNPKQTIESVLTDYIAAQDTDALPIGIVDALDAAGYVIVPKEPIKVPVSGSHHYRREYLFDATKL